ncbi:MAG: 50S ribosomal protein L29 [archaeon]
MAILRKKEIRGMSDEQLLAKKQELENILSREKAASSSGMKPENPGRIKEIRRTIARINTILNERRKKDANMS